MDPNATLDQIREAIAEIAVANAPGLEVDGCGWRDLATKLASQIEDLDTWLNQGGFLPLAWQNFNSLKSAGAPHG